jgi:hypothetical protein
MPRNLKVNQMRESIVTQDDVFRFLQIDICDVPRVNLILLLRQAMEEIIRDLVMATQRATLDEVVDDSGRTPEPTQSRHTGEIVQNLI